jgi:hypothetical protein
VYYKDLTPYSRYMPSEVENVLNIGWLDKEHDFEQAPPPHGLVEKISSILSVRGNGRNCRVNQEMLRPVSFVRNRQFRAIIDCGLRTMGPKYE